MKQAIQPYNEEAAIQALYQSLATDIEFQEIHPAPIVKPAPLVDTNSVAFRELVRQEASRIRCAETARNLQRQANPLPALVLPVATLGAAGYLAFQIATNFNPVAALVSVGGMLIVGALTKPSHRKEPDAPGYMPRNSEPVKQANINVNPVVNIAVNVQQ